MPGITKPVDTTTLTADPNTQTMGIACKHAAPPPGHNCLNTLTGEPHRDGLLHGIRRLDAMNDDAERAEFPTDDDMAELAADDAWADPAWAVDSVTRSCCGGIGDHVSDCAATTAGNSSNVLRSQHSTKSVDRSTRNDSTGSGQQLDEANDVCLQSTAMTQTTAPDLDVSAHTAALALTCDTCKATAGHGCTNALTGDPLPGAYVHAPRWLALQKLPEPKSPADTSAGDWEPADGCHVPGDLAWQVEAGAEPVRDCTGHRTTLTTRRQCEVELEITSVQRWDGTLARSYAYLDCDTELSAEECRAAGVALFTAAAELDALAGEAVR